jgi:cytochrome b561
MVQLANTERHYGSLAIVLHWLIALLITALIAVGIYMVGLPDAGFDDKKIMLILAHKEIGVLVLVLAAIRLVWRQLNPLPALAETVPEWQQIAAAFVHIWLYALMLAQPMTGWLMSSASGIPVDFLGLFTLTDLVQHDDELFARLRWMHDWLGLAMGALICLHAAVGVWHHFGLRDETLRKMLGLPGRSD